MKDLPYFKWYPADADTDAAFRAMDDADIGFYIRCLNHAWMNGSIPADSKERARVLRTRLDTANKRWVRVGKCFVNSTLYPEQLINLRQEKERNISCLKSLKATESVNHRYERNTDVLLRARVSETETDTDTKKEPPKPPAPIGADTEIFDEIAAASQGMVRPDVPPQKKEPRRRAGKRTTEDIRRALNGRATWFDEFWKVYPNHDAMNPTMDAYERAVADHDKAVLLWKGAKVYAAKAAADPTMKTAHGATWIHQERWLDENALPIPAARPQQKSFMGDVTRVIGERIAKGEEPW